MPKIAIDITSTGVQKVTADLNAVANKSRQMTNGINNLSQKFKTVEIGKQWGRELDQFNNKMTKIQSSFLGKSLMTSVIGSGLSQIKMFEGTIGRALEEVIEMGLQWLVIRKTMKDINTEQDKIVPQVGRQQFAPVGIFKQQQQQQQQQKQTRPIYTTALLKTSDYLKRFDNIMQQSQNEFAKRYMSDPKFKLDVVNDQFNRRYREEFAQRSSRLYTGTMQYQEPGVVSSIGGSLKMGVDKVEQINSKFTTVNKLLGSTVGQFVVFSAVATSIGILFEKGAKILADTNKEFENMNADIREAAKKQVGAGFWSQTWNALKSGYSSTPDLNALGFNRGISSSDMAKAQKDREKRLSANYISAGRIAEDLLIQQARFSSDTFGDFEAKLLQAKFERDRILKSALTPQEKSVANLRYNIESKNIQMEKLRTFIDKDITGIAPALEYGGTDTQSILASYFNQDKVKSANKDIVDAVNNLKSEITTELTNAVEQLQLIYNQGEEAKLYAK